MPLVMRLAQPCDLDGVMRILLGRVDWLRQNGSDQWSTSPTFRPRIAKSISLQQTWLLLDSEKLVGTISVHTDGDPDFWTPEELQHRALYVAKMATAVENLGQGLGKLLIEWAQDWAARQEMVAVRWDAWRTNARLLDYYRGLGARHVRTVDDDARLSGALFEVPAQAMPVLAVETKIYP